LKPQKQFKQDLDDAEQEVAKAEAAEQAERLKQARKFNPKEILAKANQPRTIYDEDLGCISYLYLSDEDLTGITMMKDLTDHERALHILSKQLVDPKVTVDELKKMPYEVVVRLIMCLQGEGSFFFKPKPAQSRNSLSG
jgi:hypothetical protein